MKPLPENIRDITNLDDTELRNSLKMFGWHKELPAISDEKGTILVGHRRLKIARELGIHPYIKKIWFGEGEKADAEKIKLALITNIGAHPLSPEDRQRLAMYLYHDREWVQEKIAKALNVSQRTISTDLKSTLEVTSKAIPKSTTPKKGKAAQATPVIIAMKDAGKSTKEIAKETGVHPRNVAQVLEHEQIAREARLEASITNEVMSMSARQKLDLAIKRETKRLGAQFEALVQKEVEDRIGFLLKKVQVEVTQAYEDQKRYRKGGFKFKEMVYKKILHCLHPDSRHSMSDARLGEAFQAFRDAERYLMAEPEKPPEHPLPPPLPTTMEELLAAREEVRQRNSQRAKEAHLKRQKLKEAQ